MNLKDIFIPHFGKFMGIIQCICICLLFGMNEASAIRYNQIRKLNLSFENVQLRDVLHAIKKQTNLNFVYNAAIINDKEIISVKLENVDLHTALNRCLHGLDIDYTIENKIIVLQKKEKESPQQIKPKILKGSVVDQEGNPLPGVSVTVKGSHMGVATDDKGMFHIAVSEKLDNPELLFTFIGMEPVRFKIKDDRLIRIVMKEDSKNLDEVIVTGMEVLKKDHMTGSATVITAKDLKMQGITSLDRILEGMIAGLNSTTVSGAPGSRSKITIRGENTLNGNTEPLWIVDGLPLMSGVPKSTTGDYAGTVMQDGVGNIMPEDIESITILKDASAAAIYGARAANGVIVITTKKGFRSKTQIHYSGTYDCSIAPKNHMDFMNSSEKLDYEKGLVEHFGIDAASKTGRGGYLLKRYQKGHLTQEQYNSEIEKLKHIDTDWFKELFRPAHSHSHNISLRGGNEELSYYTSLSFQQQKGILMSNEYESAGMMIRLDYRPMDNLIIALNANINSRKNKDHASNVDPFIYATFANTYERPFDENGEYEADLSYLGNNYTTETASGYKYDKFNIIKELRETQKKMDGLDASLTLNLRYEIIPGLSFESIIRKGISHNTNEISADKGTYTSWTNEQFGKLAYPNAKIIPSRFDNGELSENAGKNHNWSIRNQIDYSFKIRKGHLFSIMLANEVMSKKFNNFGYKSPMYDAEFRITGIPQFGKEIGYDKLRGAIQGMFNTSEGQDRSVSFLGALRYGYKDRYVANLTYRADGADIIGDNNRFNPFWSVGIRYNLHKEKFLKDTFISELALRGSFGYTGNIDRSTLPHATIKIGNNEYMGNRYVTKYTYPNPTVKWEKKRDKNIGMDLGLFKNKVNLSVEYYFNRTKDILENLEVPASTGRTPNTNVKVNGGIVENSGMEMSLNIRWINRNDFSFSTSANIARNKNVIKKSHFSFNSYKELIYWSTSRGGAININGKETGALYGWKTCGVNPKTGNPMYYLTELSKRQYANYMDAASMDEKTVNPYGPNWTEVPDAVDFVKTDMNIPPFFMASMQYLGRTNPKYVGGFSTSLRYKGLEFTTNWTYKIGHKIENFNDYVNAPRGGKNSGDLAVSGTNREKKYLTYWKTPGDMTKVSKFIGLGETDYWAPFCRSDNYSSGNYVRMTNMAISYRFPRHLTERLGLENCNIGFNARNLLTFTKFKGMDIGTGKAFSYPTSRQFNFRLSIGF